MIPNWKDLTHDERVTVCRQMDAQFTKHRREWHQAHRASYEYATKHGIIASNRSANGTSDRNGNRIGSIAAYRDELHRRLKHNPGLERMAGEELAKSVDMGWPVERCVAHVEKLLGVSV